MINTNISCLNFYNGLYLNSSRLMVVCYLSYIFGKGCCDFMKRSKIILSIVVFVLIFIAVFLVFILSKEKEVEKEFLDVNYGKDKTIEIDEVKKGKVYDDTIVVTNKSDKTIYYSVKWNNVNNDYVMQNKLLYEIDTDDEGASYIGKSQLPIANSPLFDKVKLEKGEFHKYYLTITYDGNTLKEKGKKFQANLEISEIK